jgi:predicted nucleic acid-binding Zn ribbon protein
MARTVDEDAEWLAGQIRPQYRRDARPIGQIVGQLLARQGYANVQAHAEWREVWQEVAGELAVHSRPARYSRQVLEVLVDHSATLQELRFHEQRLLAALRERMPHHRLKRLRWKIGTWS